VENQEWKNQTARKTYQNIHHQRLSVCEKPVGNLWMKMLAVKAALQVREGFPSRIFFGCLQLSI
jgi:hypothetical protein